MMLLHGVAGDRRQRQRNKKRLSDQCASDVRISIGACVQCWLRLLQRHEQATSSLRVMGAVRV